MPGTEDLEFGSTARDQEHLVPMCTLFAGGRLFGIDTRRIREVLERTRLERVPRAPFFIGGVMPYRGEVLTTVSLRAVLGFAALQGDGGAVLVLDDGEVEEQFGLLADTVGGVTMVDRRRYVENPPTLDERNRALFDGAYRMPGGGLLVELDPERLRPVRLASGGLHEDPVAEAGGSGRNRGGTRCER